MKRLIYLAVLLFSLPSSGQTLPMALADDARFTTFAALLRITGLDKQLNVIEDNKYRRLYMANPSLFQAPYHLTQQRYPNTAEHRLYGFTAFAETNATLAAIGVRGIDNASLANLADHLRANGLQGDYNADYTSPTNAIHRFVGYHLLNRSLAPDHLVIHYNELGYLWNDPESVPLTMVYEQYESMTDQRWLVHLSEGARTGGVRINRFSILDAANPSIEERVMEAGILIDKEGAINGGNGYIYPLTEVLRYTPATASRLAGERLRYDFASLFPELANNNMRRPYSNVGDFGWINEYQYFEGMRVLTGKVYYLPGYANQWLNYQGDEFNIVGPIDAIITLPPMPETSEYEVRIGVSANPTRGITRFSIGTDPDNPSDMTATIDMRVGGVMRYLDWNGNSRTKSYMGWTQDGASEMLNRLSDINMHEQGMMKAPGCFAQLPVVGSLDVGQSVRNKCYNYGSNGLCIRRIIGRATLQANTTYYLRITSVLDDARTQTYLDYIEFCPKSIYANPEQMEDIW